VIKSPRHKNGNGISMVPVAQLAEHLTVDQVVAGSNPVRHPIICGTFLEKSPFLSIYGGSITNHLMQYQEFGAVVVQFGADQLQLAKSSHPLGQQLHFGFQAKDAHKYPR
jgi:hypothetical protein